MKENEISHAFKNREPGAADAMVSLYGDRLMRTAFLLCKNEPDARDLVQETFLQAIKSRENFNTDYALYSWLSGILLNLNRQHYRKKKKMIFSDELENTRDGNTFDAEHHLDMEKAFSALYSIMEKLSLKHKEILILKYFEGLKIHEIAGIVGASNGTVKSRLHYAVKQMQKKMPDHLKGFLNPNPTGKEQ
jgi:RNA polymerase sigma-70 factor (ECF subfamily)